METRLKEAESFKEKLTSLAKEADAELLTLRSTPKSVLSEIDTHDLSTLEKLQEVNKYKNKLLLETLKIVCNKSIY